MPKSLRHRLALAATLLIAATGFLLGSTPLLAHHAFAADFSVDQPVIVKGTVTKFQLVNPHSWLYLTAKNADGTVSDWGFEFGAPFSLNEKGVTKSTFPIGSEVTIYGYRSKSGKNFGYAVSGVLPDGRTFRNVGGAADAPTPAPATPTPAAH
jgi:hypothetical protein